MLAGSASQLGGYAPVEPPRIAVAGDGTLAAIHEASRVTMLELPGGAAFAEVGVDPDALASDVGWVGGPPRLLVLSRYDAHSTVHLLDPHGPRTLAEIRLESPMRLVATVGGAALVVSSLGAGVLLATEAHLMLYPFPTRAVPVTAGAASGQFVVAVGGSIEEWDPQSRQRKRRLRLARSAAITAVGGSDRVVWFTTQQEPARIEVIPLINRGQPRAHELPEPIAEIASHPRCDLIACVGAQTGRLYALDLDGRSAQRVIDLDGVDRVDAVGLIAGRRIGVLAARTGRPVAVVPLDARDDAGAAPFDEATHARAPEAEPAAHPRTVHQQPLSWRDEVVLWSRAVASPADPGPPIAPLIDALVARFDLAPQLHAALVLLYGAHLCGEPGVAPVAIARLLDGNWDEALGRGELALHGIVRHAGSRVALAPLILRILDELPPTTGTLFGEPGDVALLGPCVVVAGDEPLAAVAERCLPHVGGAILVAHDGAALTELLFEARALGAAPLLRAAATAESALDAPAIFVAGDEALAAHLGIPRLG